MGRLKKLLDRLRRDKYLVELSSERVDLAGREALVAEIKLTASVGKNIRLVREALGESMDLNLNRFRAGPAAVPGAAFYIDGMVNNRSIEELLRAVKIDLAESDFKGTGPGELLDTVKERLITNVEVKETAELEPLLISLSRGETALMFEGTDRALLCDTRGWATRALEEPEAEVVIRGPREGFVESIHINTALLRRRIHSPQLWIQEVEVGRITRTRVGIAYIKGLADEKIVGEVRSRLKAIDIDGVLESGYLEEFLHDHPLSIFPLVFHSERPDRVAGALLEGRVAILTDGTPYVLVVPNNFISMIQAPDDYYELFPIGSLVRILRLISFAISIFLPGVYVAVLNYHPELLPPVLFLRIAAAREGVPLPVAVEAFVMEAIFEILREAGLRLPRMIGPAISIVGALILGDAAIRAGLISPAIVIIVAFTAIASFSVPVFSLGIAGRISRFAVILLGSVFGLLGVQFAAMVLLVHLCALRSFGVPYMYPFAPLVLDDLKDSIVRMYWWRQVKRPRLIGYRDPQRQKRGPRPGRRPATEGEHRE